MVSGKLNVVIGGQAGSEAKGKLSAYLVDKYNITVVAGCLSPNAGHTAIIKGKKYVSHHIPIGAMGAVHYGRKVSIVLGASSIINLELLVKEIATLGIDPRTVVVDYRARIITKSMIREEENTLLDIGSTAQGVGAARRDKVMRSKDQYLAWLGEIKDVLEEMGIRIEDTARILNLYLQQGTTVLYEMGQGFDLCLDHGIDPIYCTSRTINPATAFGESGVSLKYMGEVYGVIRPYPIRVNNRTGFSGPYAEAKEITWEEVGKRAGMKEGDFPGEITTTTKLPRRVFEFCWSRFEKFMRVCSPDHVCLQFANYLNHLDYGETSYLGLSQETVGFINRLRMHGTNVDYIGTGPNQEDMIDMEAP